MMQSSSFRFGALCAATIMLAACADRANPTLPVSADARAARSLASGGYVNLYDFKRPSKDGSTPSGALTALNGALYGTTQDGGAHGFGTIFSISTSGDERVIYSFQGGSDGRSPNGGLIAVKGALYGTTIAGGRHCPQTPFGIPGCGTIFSVTTSGQERVLYRFKGGSDGVAPIVGLTRLDHALYGVTWVGGRNRMCRNFFANGCGTLFAVDTAGHERVLHRFTGGNDGALPEGALLAFGGNLYGTTYLGGKVGCANDCGTIFQVSAAGTETVLYRFTGALDGANPSGGLILHKGRLYGTTTQGGSACNCGTLFETTPSGSESVLYAFKGAPDGLYPQGTLVADGGMLYGTSSGGNVCGVSGSYGGTVFQVSQSGAERIAYAFDCKSGGKVPAPGLLSLNGALYGATTFGGRHDHGTIFALTP
jgi:uncharacterized repeat protein (TIGR03803 family)